MILIQRRKALLHQKPQMQLPQDVLPEGSDREGKTSSGVPRSLQKDLNNSVRNSRAVALKRGKDTTCNYMCLDIVT